MKHDQPHSELLSAYFDGETTPQESAEAQRLQAASADARRELADFAQLSQLLRNQPRDSLPGEFAAAVMQQAERSMLLSEPALSQPQPGQPGPGQRQPGRPPGGRFSWRWAVYGTAASAAALLLSVFLGDVRDGGAPQQLAQNERLADAPEQEADIESVSRPALAASTADKLAMQDAVQPEGAAYGDRPRAGMLQSSKAKASIDELQNAGLAGAPIASAAARSDSAASDKHASSEVALRDQKLAANSNRSLGKDRAEAAASPAVAASPAEKPEAAKGTLSLVPAQSTRLTDLKVGQIVDALVSGDRISMVRVVVVDVDEGLQAVQVVLEQNSIPEQAAPESGDKAGGSKSGARRGEMVGLLVEGTGEQISAALQDLIRQTDLVIDIEMEQPIELAQLDAASRQAVSDSESERLKSRARAAEGRADSFEQQPAATPAGKKDALKETADAKSEDAASRSVARSSAKQQPESSPGDAPGATLRKSGVSADQQLAQNNAYQRRLTVPSSVRQKAEPQEKGAALARSTIEPAAPAAPGAAAGAASADREVAANARPEEAEALRKSLQKRAFAKGSVKLIFVIEPQPAKARPVAPAKPGAGGAA